MFENLNEACTLIGGVERPSLAVLWGKLDDEMWELATASALTYETYWQQFNWTYVDRDHNAWVVGFVDENHDEALFRIVSLSDPKHCSELKINKHRPMFFDDAAEGPYKLFWELFYVVEYQRATKEFMMVTDRYTDSGVEYTLKGMDRKDIPKIAHPRKKGPTKYSYTSALGHYRSPTVLGKGKGGTGRRRTWVGPTRFRDGNMEYRLFEAILPPAIIGKDFNLDLNQRDSR